MMAPKIGKQQEDRATGADAVAANEDLLILILLPLPVKSLIRFKSVSKNWLSLITSPHFCDLKSKRFSKHVTGLLLRRIYERVHFKYEFIPLDEDDEQSAAPLIRRNSPMGRLNFVQIEGRLKVVQHCNGLLLCRGFHFLEDCKYYVFNPTTKEYTAVSVNRVLDSGKVDAVRFVNLAFDPRKSPHYKLICIYCSSPGDYCYELGIYSSETGVLRQIDGRLPRPGCDYRWALNCCDYRRGLYWNNAVNWIDYTYDGLYFNIDDERVGTLPMPPVPDGMEDTSLWADTGRWIRYYGESNDRLHLIQTNGMPTAQFDVCEMDKGYSGWFVKFHVDLQQVLSSFPESINHELTPLFGVLGVVRKDEDGTSFLVLSIPGKVIRFHFEDGSFTKLCDFATANDGVYGWKHSVQFIESLHRL